MFLSLSLLSLSLSLALSLLSLAPLSLSSRSPLSLSLDSLSLSLSLSLTLSCCLSLSLSISLSIVRSGAHELLSERLFQGCLSLLSPPVSPDSRRIEDELVLHSSLTESAVLSLVKADKSPNISSDNSYCMNLQEDNGVYLSSVKQRL